LLLLLLLLLLFSLFSGKELQRLKTVNVLPLPPRDHEPPPATLNEGVGGVDERSDSPTLARNKSLAVGLKSGFSFVCSIDLLDARASRIHFLRRKASDSPSTLRRFVSAKSSIDASSVATAQNFPSAAIVRAERNAPLRPRATKASR
jgi:hypothetical protein